MKTDKIIGYLLLVVGLGMIFFSLFSVFQIFTGRAQPPPVFSFEAPSFSLPTQSSLNLELPEGMSLPEGFSLPAIDQGSQEPQKIKILPDEVINRIANMSLYFFLMMFVSSVGNKIASVGVKLIKDIKVEVKGEQVVQATVSRPTSPASPPIASSSPQSN